MSVHVAQAVTDITPNKCAVLLVQADVTIRKVPLHLTGDLEAVLIRRDHVDYVQGPRFVVREPVFGPYLPRSSKVARRSVGREEGVRIEAHGPRVVVEHRQLIRLDGGEDQALQIMDIPLPVDVRLEHQADRIPDHPIRLPIPC